MKKYLIYLCLALAIITPKHTIAKEDGCDNRYLTLINPVRSRDLWIDRRVDPLKSQYSLIKQYNFSATWLLQYDALVDEALLSEIKEFDENQERGIFLEVSQKYAEDSRVIYPHSVPWYSPKAVFLSAYTQSERVKLIDELFRQFKMKFGFYPKSVGAWWIDSYSLNYMKENYDIKAALIVADQKTTDNYGVWGQWWGVPYYPTKTNILTPASSKINKQNVVVLQWAQRDPQLAVGDGPKFSNYSLQANDYIRQGKQTDYFQELVSIYLNCQNPLGQVTVGLETGSDSVTYFEEYERQLEALKKITNLQSVTMEKFSEKFGQFFSDFPKKSVIGKGDAEWLMTPDKRLNEKIGEMISYNPQKSFDDYFIAKKDEFLNRALSSEKKHHGLNLAVSPGLAVLIILGINSFFKKKLRIWFFSSIFTLSAFGLILRSDSQFGWWVYYGPVLENIYLYQVVLPVISFLMFLYFQRFRDLKLWILPLTFAIDPIIASLHASFISEKYFIGFMLDALRFTGVSIRNNQVEFINADLPGYLAAGLLRFDFTKIWHNLLAALILYPLAHILLAIVLNLIFKRSFKINRLVILMMIFFLLVHLWMLFNADPFAVQSFR